MSTSNAGLTRSPVAGRHWLCALVVALSAAACSSDENTAPVPDVASDTTADSTNLEPDAADGSAADSADDTDASGPPPQFEAANSVPEGDPLYVGQQLFLNETFGTGVLSSMPPADFLVQLMETEPEVFGNQFENFGFIADPGNEFPIGLRRDPLFPDEYKETCALCHVATLPDGRVWIGAPNESLQLTAFNLAVEERWMAAGNPALFTEAEREKLRQLGPGRTSAESGSYPRLVPANYPPYWDIGLRNDLNYMGTGQNMRTEVYFSLFSAGCGDPNDEEAIVPWPAEELLAPFIEYMSSLRPPEAPAQDAEAVARGQQVFEEANCTTCHIVDDPEAEFVVPLDFSEGGRERYAGEEEGWPRGSLRTSRVHRFLADGDPDFPDSTDERVGILVSFIISKGLTVRQTDGYRTNTLRGLWATAPFLHNGSVPTLEDLLKPASERPVSFMQGEHQVDTRLFGFSNEGHEFGVDLSAEEKADLLVYLRSL